MVRPERVGKPVYEFVRRAPVRSGCEGLGKPDKRLVKRDLAKTTGKAGGVR